VFLFISGNCFAITIIPEYSDKTISVLNKNFAELDKKINHIQIVKTAPNGNMKAERGTLIIYDTGAALQLWMDTDGNKTWVKIGP
jgi:hypothetical protein